MKTVYRKKMSFLFLSAVLCCSTAIASQFRLDKYYDSMDQTDKTQLAKQCALVMESKNSPNAQDIALNYTNLVVNLSKKYPDLSFMNPCGFFSEN